MELKVTSFSKEKFLEENITALEKKDINFPDFAFLLGKGFSLEEMVLYGLNRENYSKYLPNSIRYRITLNTNNGYWPILHDKMLFYSFVKEHLPTPRLLGHVFLGKLTSISKDFSESSFCQENKKFVLKPLQGGKGQGIFFIENQSGQLFVNGQNFNIDKLQKLLPELHKYGIFEYMYQHRSISDIYPASVNTIRLVTLQDLNTKKPYIFGAVLRIGWEESKPFDNFSQGGLVAWIDLESGKISSWKRKNNNGEIEEGDEHPNTGFKLSGFTIPHWELIKEQIINYLEKHPFLNYIGWDIMITNEGFSIIEGNHNPDLDLIQIFKGYLTEKQSVIFFNELDIYE